MYVATRLISNPLKGIKPILYEIVIQINEGMVDVRDEMVQGKGSMGGGIVRSSGWGQGVEGPKMVGGLRRLGSLWMVGVQGLGVAGV